MTQTIVREPQTCQGFASCETTFSSGRGEVPPMPDSVKVIAARLIRTRLALGYDTQAEFAETLGLGKGTYNPFETGQRRISLEAAIKMREVHKIPLDWIFCGDHAGLPVRVHQAILKAA